MSTQEPTPQELERGWTWETDKAVAEIIADPSDTFHSSNVLNYLAREGLLAPLGATADAKADSEKEEKTMAQLHEDLLPEPARIPRHRLNIDALTDDIEDPTAAVQYAVRDRQGELHVDGDQQWVADGRALRDGHDGNGTTMRRTVTISYGAWEPWP
jgi:hypothetical protein